MEIKPKSFRKNFAFGAWLKLTSWLFNVTILVTIIWNYFDSGHTVKEVFEPGQIYRHVVIALVTGWVITIWRGQDADDKEQNPPLQQW